MEGTEIKMVVFEGRMMGLVSASQTVMFLKLPS